MPKDNSTVISEEVVPYLERPTKEVISDIEYGLDGILDEHEKAELHNSNVVKNTQGKESMLWPNASRSKEAGMAQGLEALEKLGDSNYELQGDIPGRDQEKTTR